MSDTVQSIVNDGNNVTNMSNVFLAQRAKLKSHKNGGNGKEKTGDSNIGDDKSNLKTTGDKTGFGKSKHTVFEKKRFDPVTVAELKEIRSVTGLYNDEARTEFFLRNGIDAWYDELERNLERNRATGSFDRSMTSPSISDITFSTSTVTLPMKVKILLHSLFAKYFLEDTKNKTSIEAAIRLDGPKVQSSTRVHVVSPPIGASSSMIETAHGPSDSAVRMIEKQSEFVEEVQPFLKGGKEEKGKLDCSISGKGMIIDGRKGLEGKGIKREKDVRGNAVFMKGGKEKDGKGKPSVHRVRNSCRPVYDDVYFKELDAKIQQVRRELEEEIVREGAVSFESSSAGISSFSTGVFFESNEYKPHEYQTLTKLLLDLEQAIVTQHGASAFVKLTTRSPKDSFFAFSKARRSIRDWKRKNDFDSKPDHNALWTEFVETLRLEQRCTSAWDALLLLATSRRVYDDLDEEFKHEHAKQNRRTEEKKGSESRIVHDGIVSMGFGEAKSEAFDFREVVEPKTEDVINISIRTFHPKVTPATEFRGFVFNKEFNCAGQYFAQLYFPELQDDVKSRGIEQALQDFYYHTLAPNIPDFLNQCPCFMMDLVCVHHPDVEENRNGSSPYLNVISVQNGDKKISAFKTFLVEINPFDGECFGVFPGSTGLFSWDNKDDRELIMGKRRSICPSSGKKFAVSSSGNCGTSSSVDMVGDWHCTSDAAHDKHSGIVGSVMDRHRGQMDGDGHCGQMGELPTECTIQGDGVEQESDFHGGRDHSHGRKGNSHGYNAGFELRLRTQPLITERNLKSHPDLRNVSPLFQSCIYSQP